jgi:hypothetical protein
VVTFLEPTSYDRLVTGGDFTPETAAIMILSQTVVRLEELLRKYIRLVQGEAGTNYLGDRFVEDGELSDADLAELRRLAALAKS